MKVVHLNVVCTVSAVSLIPTAKTPDAEILVTLKVDEIDGVDTFTFMCGKDDAHHFTIGETYQLGLCK